MNKYVIIGDPDADRFAKVRDDIQGSYQLEVLQAASFDRLLAEYREHVENLELVLLTDHFPEPHFLPNYFDQLATLPIVIGGKAVVGYLHGDPPRDLELSLNPPALFVPFPKDAESLQMFLQGLGTKFFLRRLPKLTLDDDALLRQQVRSFGRDQSLEDGKNRLRQIIGGFFLDDVTVYRLRSGLSRASVFRLQVRGRKGEHIIKLVDSDWKVDIEARQHSIVAGGIPGLRASKPHMEKPKATAPADGFVVSFLGLHGICYGFLGGPEFGPCLDLQKALLARSDELAQAVDGTSLAFASPARGHVEECRLATLRLVVEWLKKEWCITKLASRAPCRPWHPGDGPTRSYGTFPPYRLAGRTKGKILGFLDSSDAAIGRRLRPDWDGLANTVSMFVRCEEGIYSIPKLDRDISMIRSPAHGDLNSNNVLLYPRLADPVFLIDFPMYQAQGHALQDFARLETEIKFALMDRQEDSPISELAGLDYTPSQFALWCELDDHLGSERLFEGRSWASSGFRPNVDLTLRLVQTVRSAATDVQRQIIEGSSAPTFLDEYLFPLLYQTLRSITYQSLSPFKRILAVYSAAKLLNAVGYSPSIKT